jgi:hypothetical protein
MHRIPIDNEKLFSDNKSLLPDILTMLMKKFFTSISWDYVVIGLVIGLIYIYLQLKPETILSLYPVSALITP